MKNDTKNIHLCFENLFINIFEDKQDENTNNYGRMGETRYNLNVTAHKAYDWKKFRFRYWACKHISAKNSENAWYFRISYVLFSSLDQTN